MRSARFPDATARARVSIPLGSNTQIKRELQGKLKVAQVAAQTNNGQAAEDSESMQHYAGQPPPPAARRQPPAAGYSPPVFAAAATVSAGVSAAGGRTRRRAMLRALAKSLRANRNIMMCRIVRMRRSMRTLVVTCNLIYLYVASCNKRLGVGCLPIAMCCV